MIKPSDGILYLTTTLLHVETSTGSFQDLIMESMLVYYIEICCDTVVQFIHGVHSFYHIILSFEDVGPILAGDYESFIVPYISTLNTGSHTSFPQLTICYWITMLIKYITTATLSKPHVTCTTHT